MTLSSLLRLVSGKIIMLEMQYYYPYQMANSGEIPAPEASPLDGLPAPMMHRYRISVL